MHCPDTGTWRAWVDDEAPVVNADDHLSGCPDCTREVGRLRADARYAATAVAVLDAPVAADSSFAADAPAKALAAPTPTGHGRGASRSRQWSMSAAAALVAFAVVATPAGRAAAGDFLSLFRSERVSLLAVDETSLTHTAEVLDELGDAHEVTEPDPVEVADVATAIERTGLPVTVPEPSTLPESADTRPVIRVTDTQQLTFEFDEAATRQYLAQYDQGDRVLPDGYDGATLVVTVPAAVLQEYRDADGLPAALVGHAGAVTAEVDGDIDLETLRAFLLELPGLPQSVVRQLAAIDDWRTTLPIPVPIDRVGGQETTVDGAEAIFVEQANLGTALLWQRDGVVTGVAGRLDEAELRAVVAGLRAP